VRGKPWGDKEVDLVRSSVDFYPPSKEVEPGEARANRMHEWMMNEDIAMRVMPYRRRGATPILAASIRLTKV